MAQTYNPQIVISAAPGITGFLRLALYEATAPNVEVAASAQLPPPHFTSRAIQFVGRRPVIHLAKLFVTDGIAPTGTLIADFSIDPRYPGVEIKPDLFIYGGETEGFDVGGNTFDDITGELDGWVYDVDIRGYGKLDPAKEFTPFTVGSGYTVDIPEYQVQEGELHIISFKPKLVVYAGEPDSPQLFSTTRILTENTALSETDIGKLIVLRSATSRIIVTLPDIGSIAGGKAIWINSNGGQHLNATVLCEGSAGEQIDVMGQLRVNFLLAQGESAIFVKWVDENNPAFVRWELASDADYLNRVGEVFYSNKFEHKNALPLVGQLVDRDVYPRLWEHVQQLESALLVSDNDWINVPGNAAKFSTGNLSTTFRLPFLAANAGFLRVVNGTSRKAGNFQVEQVGRHTHRMQVWGTKRGAGGDPNDGAINRQQSNSGSFGTEGTFVTELNGEPTDENRPANTGIYAFIRI